MASFGEELAFLKTQALSLRSIPITLDNDYQPALQDVPRRLPLFPIQVPPPPTSSTTASSSKSTEAIPDLIVKSTKPPLTFQLTGILPTDTIAHIKSQLALQHPRAPLPDVQRLLIKGKVLADTKLLKEYPSTSTITLMTKPGSTWTGEERVAAPVADGAIVTSEPESFAQPTPTPAAPSTSNLRPAGARGHGRSLSGEASNMPVPSVTLSPTPSTDGTSPGVDLTLAVDLDLQPEQPRSLTPQAEAFQQVIVDEEFWTRFLEFLKSEFKTPGDATMAWEEFFRAAKSHLTPNQIAKIRDTTGIVAMAGH